MPYGPVMLDLEGYELTSEEQEILAHPLVGGIIFFSRNYHSIEQLQALVASIRAAQKNQLLIAVDHEGGRVQRFRDGFSRLPAPRTIYEHAQANLELSCQYAKTLGWLMAAELRALDIDFSFAPVLDLNYNISDVIGDRAFHRNPEIVSQLATAYVTGMQQAGMAAVGKHFPGHGAIKADSHIAIPIDTRDLVTITQQDLIPFKTLIQNQTLQAIMPAHVIYAKIDSNPAGFSSIWIQQILRQQLQFDGMILSDDLDMAAAHQAGDFIDRAQATLQAGCDMAVVCNHRQGALQILDQLNWTPSPQTQTRQTAMQGQASLSFIELKQSSQWQTATELAHRITHPT